ncbi:hypothetical protein [Parabacteroides sp.]
MNASHTSMMRSVEAPSTPSKSRKVLSLMRRLAKASFVLPSSLRDDGISLFKSSSKWIWAAK